jgi:hypothetical protein
MAIEYWTRQPHSREDDNVTVYEINEHGVSRPLHRPPSRHSPTSEPRRPLTSSEESSPEISLSSDGHQTHTTFLDLEDDESVRDPVPATRTSDTPNVVHIFIDPNTGRVISNDERYHEIDPRLRNNDAQENASQERTDDETERNHRLEDLYDRDLSSNSPPSTGDLVDTIREAMTNIRRRMRLLQNRLTNHDQRPSSPYPWNDNVFQQPTNTPNYTNAFGTPIVSGRTLDILSHSMDASTDTADIRRRDEELEPLLQGQIDRAMRFESTPSSAASTPAGTTPLLRSQTDSPASRVPSSDWRQLELQWRAMLRTRARNRVTRLSFSPLTTVNGSDDLMGPPLTAEAEPMPMNWSSHLESDDMWKDLEDEMNGDRPEDPNNVREEQSGNKLESMVVEAADGVWVMDPNAVLVRKWIFPSGDVVGQ